MMPDENRPEATPARKAGKLAGTSIGPYRLLEILGEGGMGTVYLAEQAKPILRRVALKLIKLGMDTNEVIARFEAERQALALMDHPCIAKVHDAGVTNDGRPYFVMEHVTGIPITEYCDKHLLETRERLDLFAKVCRALHHAHQRGIIHRDVKPTNVLVTVEDGKAIPKVIDFGLAKAMGARLTERTFFTAHGRLVGTPAYMSPEQAEMSGLDIDTTTDVYSLGVLLYELLTGSLPIEPARFKEAGLEALSRVIREYAPPNPSQRISSLGDGALFVAHHRHTFPASLEAQLRGELDWVVMRAMEKDRTRRYASASEFAEDIARVLRYEPVAASPASTAYRMGKFVRRHRVGVGFAALVFLLVISSGVGMGILWQRAVVAEAQARNDVITAEQVSDFLVDLFKVSDPSEARGSTITAREILDKGSKEIQEELAAQPVVRARLMRTMGSVYRNLGLYQQARPLLEEALSSLDSELDGDHLEVARSVNNLANLLQVTGDYEGAQPLYVRALSIREKTLGADHPDVAQSLNNLAVLLKETGEYERARPLAERAVAIQEKTLGPDSPDVAKGLHNLAMLLEQSRDYEGAQPLYERSLAILERTFGEDHPHVAMSLNNLANLRRRTGDHVGADPLYVRALAIREKALGADHPLVAMSLSNLGELRSQAGDYGEARPLYERALAIFEKSLGADHPHVAGVLYNLACLHRDTDDPTRALTMFERANNVWENSLGPSHPAVVDKLQEYAELLRQTGRAGEAEKLEARAIGNSTDSRRR